MCSGGGASRGWKTRDVSLEERVVRTTTNRDSLKEVTVTLNTLRLYRVNEEFDRC